MTPSQKNEIPRTGVVSRHEEWGQKRKSRSDSSVVQLLLTKCICNGRQCAKSLRHFPKLQH